MSELSYENEQRAADVLTHYLKESVQLGNEDAGEEGARAARNIRAAFEALEASTAPPRESGSTPQGPCGDQ
ncbi:hypothetical protein C7446_2335 [Kushneria sinocarnis]|uniref:Uncharacterized protein n=1 Tax=Kushneria sinocarnis TaxID=595502 RepID=A0A420WVN8_9GAMM|nr:hypothetical protein [Kushneria sinocarnis]RKR02617.1 hypothetical protein C7446_2335 [Kushneria sinocarnis]